MNSINGLVLEEYFQQIFNVIMGTNVAPILENIYLARLEKLLLEKCKMDKHLFGQFCLEGLSMMVLASQKETEKSLIIG